VALLPQAWRDTAWAMSEENVEVVRRAFEALNRGDLDAALRFVHEDASLHLIGGFEDLMGEEFDREGFLRFWRELAGTVGVQVKVERTVDLGERVAVILILEGIGAESGAPGALRTGQVWSFRDGRVFRVDSYYDPAEALEAAGLSE
jgi:ketosteroid isomerase-like protein